MRSLYVSLLLLLPLLAAGPAVAGDGQGLPGQVQATQAVQAVQIEPQAAPGTTSSGSMLLQLWQADDGQSWALLTSSAGTAPSPDQVLDFHGLGFASQQGGTVQYMPNAHWSAHARVRQQSWLGASTVGQCLSGGAADLNRCADGSLTPSLMQSEIGATFKGVGYSVGMDVSTTRPSSAAPLLPRVVPNAPLTSNLNGLPFGSLLDSTSLHARGRVAVGARSGIDVGAGMGRIRLLPGNVLGIDTLGQKSLSFGLDSGPVSGHIIGRVIQPESGAAGVLGPDHRWTSIDLGITWRLPWQGSLSFGAQNLWSSGHAPEPADGPKADQSRIPYVQYHQDF